jgi:hypothetical protein
MDVRKEARTMNKIICPVKGCLGSETSSGHPNSMNHIRNVAKTELLTAYILGEGSLLHAEYLKKNAKAEVKTIFRIGKFTLDFNK